MGNFPYFHPTAEWIRLVKWVASTIGVPVAAGICEIFPPDSLPSRCGKGMCAPGCWNPGMDSFSEIVWKNCPYFPLIRPIREVKKCTIELQWFRNSLPRYKEKNFFLYPFFSFKCL